LPNPGYRYQGSAFQWPTLPDLLEETGISWRIYQDPNDNWTGAMHGGLAFQSFRSATAGSPLYTNGMQLWTLEHLRDDVLSGTLPAVSWVLPSRLNSEHPGAESSPYRGGNFTAQVLDAITASPATWSKTAFFLTYDENDGFFDHVAPPAVPSYNADGSLAGAATMSLAGEYFSDPEGKYRYPGDSISGSLRPWGLGPRVPMYVISPWSKGGWVNSQVFDHTSIGMFLEKRFGINVPNISPWHRAVSGDLTSAFNFASPNEKTFPELPDVSAYAAVEARQATLPAPVPPRTVQSLFQEPGTRYSRALPYELHTSARASSLGTVRLLFGNTGTQGAVFHVYDRLHLDRIPRRYTVEAGKNLDDVWDTVADGGNYDLWVYGPNGFVRAFQGNGSVAEGAELQFRPEIQVCYDPCNARIYLKVHDPSGVTGHITVNANAYRNDGPWTLKAVQRAVSVIDWNLTSSGNWYDFSVNGLNFMRRFAGRMETGVDGVSDPALAQGLSV
jgi:phospholipase C